MGENKHAHQFAFGIGGRMCVASHLAHNALYTAFLHMVANFHILPGDETQGIDIAHPLDGLFARERFVATPRGYAAKFVPRDENGLRNILGV